MPVKVCYGLRARHTPALEHGCQGRQVIGVALCLDAQELRAAGFERLDRLLLAVDRRDPRAHLRAAAPAGGRARVTLEG